MTGLSEDWDRYALVVDLAERLHGNGKLGKKALQKLVYLLQRLEHVPVATGSVSLLMGRSPMISHSRSTS